MKHTGQSDSSLNVASEPLLDAIDLAAENTLLRDDLARSLGAGVRRELVTEELKHRIGNLIAVVQAIARQTFKTTDPSSLADFNARLLALAAAQNVLVDSETRGANMRDVVVAALAPHCVDGDRCTISGPALPIGGRRAHGLTLALHELATNAQKYGALSVREGWVEVLWTTTGDQLDFIWREHKGPSVARPSRTGFGSRLITHNLQNTFRGSVDLTFETTGVACHLIASVVENNF